jgi:uncharacterized membrane protein
MAPGRWILFGLNRLGVVFLAAALLLLAPAPAHAASYSSVSLDVRAYADGSTYMSQSLKVSPGITTIDVPLLTPVLSDVVATDQNGSPLSFEISGSNITIYTLGASAVTLRYDSQNMTSKQGAVWTIDFVTEYNATVTLPDQATISYVSGTPYSLGLENGSPTASLPPGTWEISYGVPIGAVSSTTSSSLGPGGPPPGIGMLQVEEGIGLGAAAVVAFLAVRWWRGRLDLGSQGSQLRPDDTKVLSFIQEKGGKVLEPEIRTRFALPKTSAWRQIKRLERLGYVKVTKIGSQNQIELLKNREPGA